MRALVACVCGLLLLTACDDLVGPRTFDDCILKSMRGVTSDVAARQIRESCREKFSEDNAAKAKSRELKPWEIGAFSGRAGINSDYFSGSLYNGNKDITVTELRIAVIQKAEGKDTSRTYTTNVTIPPLSTESFMVQIIVDNANADYSWAIEGARGY